MSISKIKDYWNNERSGTMTPPIKILPCKCGKLPSHYSSSGGFNYYGYYKCDKCNLFATGNHQFPAQIGGENTSGQPKLFVVYRGETNPEDGWNEFISELLKVK